MTAPDRPDRDVVNSARRRSKTPLLVVKILLNILGFLLFVLLLGRIGIPNLLFNLKKFGAGFILICLVGAGWLMAQAAAWSIIQNSLNSGRISFLTFFRIKIMSDALNTLIPSANLGGDITRAYVIRKYIRMRDSVPGVLADKTLEFVAGAIFMAGGLLGALLSLPLPQALMDIGWLCLFLTVAGLILLIYMQIRGFYKPLLRLSRFVPKLNRAVHAKESEIRSLDQNFGRLYGRPRHPLILAEALHLFARALGLLEIWIVLGLLGSPVSAAEAFLIGSLVAVANTVFFLMPGQWGVSEGAHVFLLQSLGRPAAIGLSLGVIRRIRKIIFIGLGLILINLENHRAPRHPQDNHDRSSDSPH